MAEVAIIMPVWGQGPLLCESIGSALAQETDVPYSIILVDDACPEEQTVDTCNRFARAHPDRVLYWRSPENRGLAAMRNRGAELALERWPDLLGIISFDGDDRLHPLFLQRSVDALRTARAGAKPGQPRIGWIFEDPDHFGNDGVMLRTHGYSALWSMAGCANCPTSICDADVYRAGIRFREDMKSGSEDWQFWLQCLSRGFRGQFIPHLGFRYRRRAASMSSFAMQLADSNKADIRLSLPDVFNPDFFLKAEAEELPRYLVGDEYQHLRIQTSATAQGTAITTAEYVSDLQQVSRLPTARVPQYLVLAPRAVLASLRRQGLLDWALWQAEHLANSTDVASLQFNAASGEDEMIRLYPARRPDLPQAAAQLICMSSTTVIEMVRKRWGLPAIARAGRLHTMEIDLDVGRSGKVAPVVNLTLQNLRAEMRGSLPATRRDLTVWRPFGLTYGDLTQEFFGVRCLMSGLGRQEECLVVAEASTLAVPEALAELRELREALREAKQQPCALLILGTHVDPTWGGGFDMVLLNQGMAIRNAAQQDSCGPEVLGQIAPFGTVVSFGSAAIAPYLNRVRTYGRTVLGTLPAATGGSLNRDLGTCFKVFNGFLAASEDAIDRAEAMGVAEEQIAPSIQAFLARSAQLENRPR
ncbi:MAG: glycosyltransferase family A protein [Pseudomonadota bacterium]